MLGRSPARYGAIVLYTGNAIYRALNEALRVKHALVPRYLPYIKLFFSAAQARPHLPLLLPRLHRLHRHCPPRLSDRRVHRRHRHRPQAMPKAPAKLWRGKPSHMARMRAPSGCSAVINAWRNAGIAADLFDEYEPGKVITWWTVSSTTASEQAEFLSRQV